MAKKPVLAIGIEPALADYQAMPGLTPELIRQYMFRWSSFESSDMTSKAA